MVEHGRGNVRLEYGRRLFSTGTDGSRTGDFTLKVSIYVYRVMYLIQVILLQRNVPFFVYSRT